jgi:hypothetical protein
VPRLKSSRRDWWWARYLARRSVSRWIHWWNTGWRGGWRGTWAVISGYYSVNIVVLVGNSDLVPISGTPIGSGIPILFSIPKTPVGIFFEFRC